MTDLLEMAVEAAKQLPPEKRDQAARAILDVVNGTEEEIYILSEEEKAAIAIGLAETERGEFASEEEVAALFAKYHL